MKILLITPCLSKELSQFLTTAQLTSGLISDYDIFKGEVEQVGERPKKKMFQK